MNIKSYLLIQEAIKRWYDVDVVSEEFSLFYLFIKGKKILFKNADCGLWSSLSHKLCKSKAVTNYFLDYNKITIPQYNCFTKADIIDMDKISFPVVVKPHDRSCNKGVTIWIENKESLSKAIDIAYNYSDKIIVQKYVEWDLFRVFIINGKIAAVTMLCPPSVFWDGVSSIKELIDKENTAIYRGWKMLDQAYPIVIESELLTHIQSMDYSLESVLDKNIELVLRKNPQLSLGGITKNITPLLHPALEQDCVKAASILWLPWAGIDIISKNIESGEYSIIEVNSQPDFKMHHYPVVGNSINIASLLLDYIINI